MATTRSTGGGVGCETPPSKSRRHMGLASPSKGNKSQVRTLTIFEANCQNDSDQIETRKRKGLMGQGSSVAKKLKMTDNIARKIEQAKECCKKFVAVSRPARLCELMRGFNPKQKEDIIAIGFGGLLQMDITRIPGEMHKWLIANFNADSGTMFINGEPKYAITWADVRDIFLLPHNKDVPVLEEIDADVNIMRDRWAAEYGVNRKGRTKNHVLEKVIAGLTNGGEDFQRMFVLYAVSTFLAPVANRTIDYRILKSLLKVENIAKQDWCEFVLQKTRASIQRYKTEKKCPGGQGKVTRQLFFSGCTLLLMLTYIHRVLWRGIRLPRTLPLVKHWNKVTLRARVTEELNAGGFGNLLFDKKPYPISKEVGGPISSCQEKRFISFVLPENACDDARLQVLLPNENQRLIASLSRDLELVLGDRLNQIFETKSLCNIDCEGLKASLTYLLDKVDAVLSKFQNARDLIHTQIQTWGEACTNNDNKTAQQENGTLLSDGTKSTPFVGRVIPPATSTTHHFIDGHIDKDQEQGALRSLVSAEVWEQNPLKGTDEVSENKSVTHVSASGDDFPENMRFDNGLSPRLQWPTNTVRHFDSEICKYVHEINSEMPITVLEVADYAISSFTSNSKCLHAAFKYSDFSIEKNVFSCFERKKRISNQVVSAWARCLNAASSDYYPDSHYCFGVVPLGDLGIHMLHDEWDSWITECPRDISKSNLIFIPVNWKNHVFLVVVNLKAKTIQYLDNLVEGEVQKWEESVKIIRKQMAKLLLRVHHPKAAVVHSFKIIIVEGDWRSTSVKKDAGIYVMHLMKNFNGEPRSIDSSLLNKAAARMELRVTFCEQILLNEANASRLEVLTSMPEFIKHKLHPWLGESLEGFPKLNGS